MKDTGICTRAENSLLKSVVNEFERGRELIVGLDDLTYRKSANGTGSVGGHIRHNLDFANSFLNGIAERQIDYNARERDLSVETDRKYAVEKMDFTMRRVGSLTSEILDRLVYVRSEVDHEVWLPSSVVRELEFLHSHTVHHHALIAEKMAGFGVAVSENFGVAPSTLEYWRQKAA